MARKVLDEELEHLNSQVLQMGSQVQRTLERTLEALITANQEIAGDIVNGDNVIDDLHLLIEEDAYRILSLQQPLYSHDLRFLTDVVPIALDLERIGDEAETCAQNLLRLLPLHFTDIMSTLREQSQDEVDGTQLSEIAVLHHILEL